MKNIKTISIFKSNENIPFMTCIVSDIEENKNGIKLTLEKAKTSILKITVISSCQRPKAIWIGSEW